MPIPLPPANGAGPDPAAPTPAAASAQRANVESTAPPALATALPAWDLLPPHQVLAFRRRA